MAAQPDGVNAGQRVSELAECRQFPRLMLLHNRRGLKESISFDKTRMVSRWLSKGSRLLVTLNVNKNPYAKINYGASKDVSDEDINDAKIPLQIKWQNDSCVKIPIWK